MAERKHVEWQVYTSDPEYYEETRGRCLARFNGRGAAKKAESYASSTPGGYTHRVVIGTDGNEQ